MSYETETKLSYRNISRAEAYKEQYEKYRWVRFTTQREQKCIEKAFELCALKDSDHLLDIPCGTGVHAKIFNKFPFSVASSDISSEMMSYARKGYSKRKFLGFVQSDIERIPFKNKTFDCVFIMGFMHRVPLEVRKKTLSEAAEISKKFIIVSYSVNSLFQKMKQCLKKKILPHYSSALSPVSLHDIQEEFESVGFTCKKRFHVVYFLSAEIIFLLEKKA